MKLVYWAAHRQVGRRHVDGKLSHQTHIGVQFLYEVAFDFLQKLYLTKTFLQTQEATKFKLYIQFLGPPLPVPRVVDLSHTLTNLIFLPFGFEVFLLIYNKFNKFTYLKYNCSWTKMYFCSWMIDVQKGSNFSK